MKPASVRMLTRVHTTLFMFFQKRSGGCMPNVREVHTIMVASLFRVLIFLSSHWLSNQSIVLTAGCFWLLDVVWWHVEMCFLSAWPLPPPQQMHTSTPFHNKANLVSYCCRPAETNADVVMETTMPISKSKIGTGTILGKLSASTLWT